MFKQYMRKRKQAKRREFESWFNSIDEETQQDTAISYLRRLDKTSLNKLLEAVEKYREGDKILKGVKDPAPIEPETPEQGDNFIET